MPRVVFQSELTPDHDARLVRGGVWFLALVLCLAYVLRNDAAEPVSAVVATVPEGRAAEPVAADADTSPVISVITLAQVEHAAEEEAKAAKAAEFLKQAVAFIEPYEGRCYRAYRDSRGHLTVGVGFNLDRAGAADDIQRLLPDVNYRALRRGEVSLTDAQINTLLEHDAQRAIDTARRQVGSFDALPRDAQMILVDMTFNTGSLHKWRKLRAALGRKDYASAADAMHRSLWRKQTGQRARQHIQTMQAISNG